jgi:hypothetical protein
MFGKPLAIPPRFLLIVLMACAVYWLIAATTEFSPLIPYSTFNQRVAECAAIWVILCSGYVGMMMFSRRPYPQGRRMWPIALIPVLVGLRGSILQAQQSWADLSSPIPGSPPAWRMVVLLMMATPLVMGVMGAAFPFILAWNWRRMHRPGTCHLCGYDLQGNVSGRCPECGLQLGGDEDKNSNFFRVHPESLLFETAAERDTAWREAGRLTRKYRGSLILYVLGLLLLLPAMTLGEWDLLESRTASAFGGALAAGVSGSILIFAAYRLDVRLRRRALRQILIEKGIPVCPHCGQDLRDAGGDTCPKCHRPLPAAVRPVQARHSPPNH